MAKKRAKHLKSLSLILIILGLLIITIPIAGQLYTGYNENRMIDEWLNSDDIAVTGIKAASGVVSDVEDAEENYNQLKNVFSSDMAGTVEEEAAAEAVLTPAGTTGTGTPVPEAIRKFYNKASTVKKADKPTLRNTIGIIKIDKIKVKAPIVEGTDADDLKAAIGHISGTGSLGSTGNCALAGHRSYTFGKFFNRLDELETGDSISIITKAAVYEYKVFEKLVVQPDDVSVLKSSKKESIVTLITCTPIYVASHRLIVKARLESKP